MSNTKTQNSRTSVISDNYVDTGNGDMTVIGASGKTVVVKELPQDIILQNMVWKYQSIINQAYIAGTLDVEYIPNTETTVNNPKPLAGIVNQSINTTIDNKYQYVIVSGENDTSTTENNVFLKAGNTTAADKITLLGGRRSGFSYTAGDESGTILTTTGLLTFNASGKTGSWNITTCEGDTNIHTGTGHNFITIGPGKASIYSEGTDNISVWAIPTSVSGGRNTQAQITIAGGNSTIFAGKGGLITDISNNNQIFANQDTTVTAGTSGAISFIGMDDNIGNNTVQGGISNNIITKNTNLTAIRGSNNNYTKVMNNLTFLNGDGNTTVNISKQFVGFGSNGLNLTLNMDNFNQTTDTVASNSLFIADKGNETLNASGYSNKLEIYANTVTGSISNLVAKGGTADDTLTAGTGNSTFTGGAGNNLFMFTKGSNSGGSTVITDFANQGSDNHIGLYNYGLNQDSIAELLKNSQNDDKGSAVLNLENHKITIEGVSVADLKTNQFVS